MDGYRLLKEAVAMSASTCANCKLEGMTFQTLPDYMVQLHTEITARELEIQTLKMQNAMLLRHNDPQSCFELLDDEA